MHFVMSAFSNHAVVLHNVTPFVQLQQTAVLSDGVVASYPHNTLASGLLLQNLNRKLRNIGADHSPPVEGWQAQPDGVVAPYLHSAQLAACSCRTLTQATKYKSRPFPSCGGVAGLCIL